MHISKHSFIKKVTSLILAISMVATMAMPSVFAKDAVPGKKATVTVAYGTPSAGSSAFTLTAGTGTTATSDKTISIPLTGSLTFHNITNLVACFNSRDYITVTAKQSGNDIILTAKNNGANTNKIGTYNGVDVCLSGGDVSTPATATVPYGTPTVGSSTFVLDVPNGSNQDKTFTCAAVPTYFYTPEDIVDFINYSGTLATVTAEVSGTDIILTAKETGTQFNQAIGSYRSSPIVLSGGTNDTPATAEDVGFTTATAESNGVTATATAPATVVSGQTATITVELTGTATTSGTHTIAVTSTILGDTITASQTVDVTAGQTDFTTSSKTFTFTMPNDAVTDLVITNTFKVPDVAPNITDVTFDKKVGASNTLTATVSEGDGTPAIDSTSITNIKENSVTLDSTYYSYTKPTITFTEAYLKGLSIGEHTLTVTFGDNKTADCKITVKDTTAPPVPSSACDILSFDIASSAGVITNQTIAITIPNGVSVTALTPTITVSPKATVSPDNGVATDFTNPVTYTVTAEDGSKKTYKVTVTVADAPPPTTGGTTPTGGSSATTTIDDLTTQPARPATIAENVGGGTSVLAYPQTTATANKLEARILDIDTTKISATNKMDFKTALPTETAKAAIANSTQNDVEINFVLSANLTNNPNVTISEIMVEKAVFEQAKSLGKDLTFTVTNPNGDVIAKWIFNANDIANLVDVNLALEIKAPSEVASLSGKVTPANNALVVAFGHDGALAGSATVSTYVGSKYAAGKNLFFYHINDNKQQIELISDNCTVKTDGYIDLTVATCSDYILSETPIKGAVKTSATSPSTNNPQTSDATPIMAILAMIALGCGLFVISRKKLAD